MEKFELVDILALTFISLIGGFELFYKENIVDGYLAFSMLGLLVLIHVFS